MKTVVGGLLLVCVLGCAAMQATRVDQIVLEPGQDLDQPPEPVTVPSPVYPEFARDANITAIVDLRVRVGESGRVERVQVIKGVTGLNEAAVNAIQRSVFKPALKDGHPV